MLKNIMLLAVIISVFFTGYALGQYFNAKKYFFIDMEKIMTSIKNQILENKLNHREIPRVIALKRKQVEEILVPYSKEGPVITSCKVISGAIDITEEVIKRLQ